MAAATSGNIRDKAPQACKIFTNPSGTVDLTSQFTGYPHATSLLIVQATGATTLNFKDGDGNAVAWPMDDNAVIHLPVAASSLEASVTVIVMACWNKML